MPDRDKQVQLVLTDHGIDASKAAHIDVPPGVVLVEMLPEADMLGIFHLPDTAAARYRPDVAVVLAAPRDAELERGALVAVDGYQGQWLEDFEVPGYRTENQVRVFGKATELVDGECIRVPWDECCLARITVDDEGPSVVALGTNVIVRRHEKVRSFGPMELGDNGEFYDGYADIVSIGPLADLRTKPCALGDRCTAGTKPYMRGTCEGCEEMQVGDTIWFDTRAQIDREFVFGGDPELAIIPDIAVNFRVRADEAVA
jgi:hypothetical protein